MTRPGIEPQFPGPLANTLLIRPINKKGSLNSYHFPMHATSSFNKQNTKNVLISFTAEFLKMKKYAFKLFSEVQTLQLKGCLWDDIVFGDEVSVFEF